MKQFLKNLVKSLGLALLTGCISLTLIIAILYLGGTENVIKHQLEVVKAVVLLTYVMLWPLFFGAVLTLKTTNKDPESIEDDLSHTYGCILSSYDDEKPEGDGGQDTSDDWENESGAIK